MVGSKSQIHHKCAQVTSSSTKNENMTNCSIALSKSGNTKGKREKKSWQKKQNKVAHKAKRKITKTKVTTTGVKLCKTLKFPIPSF